MKCRINKMHLYFWMSIITLYYIVSQKKPRVVQWRKKKQLKSRNVRVFMVVNAYHENSSFFNSWCLHQKPLWAQQSSIKDNYKYRLGAFMIIMLKTLLTLVIHSLCFETCAVQHRNHWPHVATKHLVFLVQIEIHEICL